MIQYRLWRVAERRTSRGGSVFRDLDGEGGVGSLGVGLRSMLGGLSVDAVRSFRAGVDIVSRLLFAFLLAELLTGILDAEGMITQITWWIDCKNSGKIVGLKCDVCSR